MEERNDLNKLRVFGCRPWSTLLPKEQRKQCLYGTVEEILYMPEQEKIIKSRHVRFDENMVFKENIQSEPKVVYEQDNEESTH